MVKPVRRIVTGHANDGRSTVVIDGPAPNVKQRRAGNGSTLLWVADETPAMVDGAVDRAARDIGVPPPRGGSLFRIAEFPPADGTPVAIDNATLLRDFGIDHGVVRAHPPRDPSIHRTRTLDYVVVLEGAIDLLLDEGDVHLTAGDVVIQQATNHAWINRSNAVCRLAMVFIDAIEPAAVLGYSRSTEGM